MNKPVDDSHIINLFKKGGRSADEAIRILVDEYGEILYRQIRHLTKNHEHANDVLQDVLIKIFQNLSSFKGDSALYTWLYRITRNETLNFLSKEKRRSGVDIDQPILEILAGHSTLDNTTPEKITDLLHKAIKTLPEKQAAVFHLKYFEEMKYSEMSKKLRTSEGALKASFFHAKEKIQDFILNELNH